MGRRGSRKALGRAANAAISNFRGVRFPRRTIHNLLSVKNQEKFLHQFLAALNASMPRRTILMPSSRDMFSNVMDLDRTGLSLPVRSRLRMWIWNVQT